MTAQQLTIAGIDLDQPQSSEELAARVTEDELALRTATAKAYLHGFQFLLVQARKARSTFSADQLNAHFLQHVDKGKLMRQSVPVYAQLRKLTEAKAQSFLMAAVNLVQHAPGLVQALHDGHIPSEHVRSAGEKLKSIPPPRPDQDWSGHPWEEGHYEDAVTRTDQAKNQLGAQLQDLAEPGIPETEYNAKAAQLRDDHHPEDYAARHRAAKSRRCVRLTPAADGMANLTAFIAASDAATIQQALAHAATNKNPEDQRSRTQQEADLLVELLSNAATPRAGTKQTTTDDRSAQHQPTLGLPSMPAPSKKCSCGTGSPARKRIFAYLMITLDQWLHLGGTLKPGQFDFLGNRPICPTQPSPTAAVEPTPTATSQFIGQQHTLSPAELLPLMDQISTLQAILTHPASGYPVGISVRTRRPAPRIRDLLLLRDQHCRFPGCRVPGTQCEVDHVNDFALGGTSELYSLALLCKKHHGGKSAGWWQVKLRPDLGDGVLEFHFPQSGQTEFTHPRFPLDKQAWEDIRTRLEEPPF